MASRLFVGNLPYEATESDLSAHFSQAGPVSRVFLPLDRDTGKPRGFAFIEYNDATHAAAAIGQFNQKPFMDRPLVVNEARPSEARGSGPPARGPGRPPAGRPPMGGPRPSGPRPSGPPRSFDSSDGEGKPAAPRRTAPAKPRRRGGKRASWEDGPKKVPIPEKRQSQLQGGFDDGDEEVADVEFDDFATSLPEDENSEDFGAIQTNTPDEESGGKIGDLVNSSQAEQSSTDDASSPEVASSED
jgi:cold-inducible RNA-binding protein